MKNCKCKYLRYIQSLTFALHETVLYLNGHPCDKEALAYYHKTKARLLEATAEFEAKYGPLTYKGVCDNDVWTWIKGPWPWEYEANVYEN